jgi:hypothetical protein
VESAESFDIAQLGKKAIKHKIEGTHSLVYTVDKEAIAKSLAGVSREAVKQELAKFPEIEKAVATIRPFWRDTLPSNPTKITVSFEGEIK